MLKLKDKERTQIINALRAGVVPPTGLRHIQVGRKDEITEIVKDLDQINAGGSTARFVSGEFGTGKSFFLTLTKLMAHEKKLLVVNADVTPERIFNSADGKAKALLTELLKNMSHKSKPEGAALKSLIETWIGGFVATNPNPTENSFYQALESLSHLTLCQDFCKILYRYLQAYRGGALADIEKCLKWFRAEYENKTEAKNELGVNRIIDDEDIHDALKLYAGFSKLAGFGGLLVIIDELAVLVRQRAPQRQKNYEAILAILNDSLQGNTSHIGFLFGATSDAIDNKDKGLFSYGALETRLASNRFANSTVKDLTGPVIPLAPLPRAEIYVLLTRLQDIHTNFEDSKRLLPKEGIDAFFSQVYSRMGAEEHLNPRDVIKEFLDLIAVLETNPDKKWSDLIKKIEIKPSTDPNNELVPLEQVQ